MVEECPQKAADQQAGVPIELGGRGMLSDKIYGRSFVCRTRGMPDVEVRNGPNEGPWDIIADGVLRDRCVRDCSVGRD